MPPHLRGLFLAKNRFPFIIKLNFKKEKAIKKRFSLLSLFLLFGIVSSCSLSSMPQGTPDYDRALDLSLFFFGAQRSGDSDSWLSGASFTRDGESAGYDLSGGWFDAGDHLIFAQTSGFSAYLLLLSYDLYPEGFQDLRSPAFSAPPSNGIPDVLDEVKYHTDWLLKTLTPSGLCYQMGDESDHASFSEPVYHSSRPISEGGEPRSVFFAVSNAANIAGLNAAVLALMAKAYLPYDASYADECSNEALLQYEYGKAHPGATGAIGDFYPAGNFEDDMALAALQLFRLTGVESYSNEAMSEINASGYGLQDFSPAYITHVEPFVEFELARIFGDASAKQSLSNRILEYMDQTTSEGLFFWADWGSLTYATTAAFTALLSYTLSGNESELDFAQANIDYILGKHSRISADAPAGFSFLIGLDSFGGGYPVSPHHSGAFGRGEDAFEAQEAETANHDPALWASELTGALVGGPTANGRRYQDSISNYVDNEPTVYANAGFAAALGILCSRN